MSGGMSSAQPESKSDRNKVVIFIIAIALIGLAVWVFLTSGAAGLASTIKKFIIWMIILAVIGLIVWAVMKWLQKPKIDLVENDRKDIVDAGVQSKPPMVKDLYFTGDKEHGEFRVGRIIGYCQIQSYKDIDMLAGLSSAQISEMDAKGRIPSEYIIKEDCFIYKRFMFPFSMFEEPKVLRCFESEHGQLIGDVKVYAVSLIRKFGYYWPNRAHLDITRIDISVIREAWRGQIHQFLRDMVAINQRAVGLDSEFKKDLDHRKLLKIPAPFAEAESRPSQQNQ
jgi:hypothetical protein